MENEKRCKCCGEIIPDNKNICVDCEKIHSAEIAAIRDFAIRLLKTKFNVDSSFCEGRKRIEEAVSVGAITTIRDGMIEELKQWAT